VSVFVTGKVYLVGAGPGDPELLTMKAVRVLREADIVLHDDLVSREILALIPRTATIISVGKRCGAMHVTQEEINAMIVAYASSGRTVVRLKSGDPMLFGRAGEEIDALRARDIDLEVVPGVSAAFAAAAALEASLTDRRKAARVIFTTGHRAQGTSTEQATHVVYMPGSDYAPMVNRLLEEGFSRGTPCAVVSAVSLETESVLRTTLGELPNSGPLPAPSILMVGDVLRNDSAPNVIERWNVVSPHPAGEQVV
jgi:uroporphyrin-III C-methyltransferase / precorrin-2 dehydrogenase / sirohydrochlorin ferrochelatase